jgi:hypothetical protein
MELIQFAVVAWLVLLVIMVVSVVVTAWLVYDSVKAGIKYKWKEAYIFTGFFTVLFVISLMSLLSFLGVV